MSTQSFSGIVRHRTRESLFTSETLPPFAVRPKMHVGDRGQTIAVRPVGLLAPGSSSCRVARHETAEYTRKRESGTAATTCRAGQRTSTETSAPEHVLKQPVRHTLASTRRGLDELYLGFRRPSGLHHPGMPSEQPRRATSPRHRQHAGTAVRQRQLVQADLQRGQAG